MSQDRQTRGQAQGLSGVPAVREGWGHAELGPETELEAGEAMRLTLKVRKVTVRPLPAWPPASFLGLQVGDVLCFSFCRRGSPQSGDLLEVTRLERRQTDGSPVLLLQVPLGGRLFSGTGATLALQGPGWSPFAQQQAAGQRFGPAHLSRLGCSSHTPDTASCPAARLSLPAACRWTAPQGAPQLFPGAGRGGG